MPLPELFRGRLTLPVIASPMFLVSFPPLVAAICRAGIVGAFPSINARPAAQLDEWLGQMNAMRADTPEMAPYGVNLILHKSNPRLVEDLDLIVKHQAPFVITSVGNPADVVKRVQAYGGMVFHDVIGIPHARKAAAVGVDGLILIAAGAGGHAGTLSPFALVYEVRQFFAGTIVLGGAISTGAHIKAAQVMGADMAYMGTRFIATQESQASEAYKNMLIEATAGDLVYTPYFSGIPANYMRQSIIASGLEPNQVLGTREGASLMGGGGVEGHKAWKDIWSAGQGVGAIKDIPTVADLVARLKAEYDAVNI